MKLKGSFISELFSEKMINIFNQTKSNLSPFKAKFITYLMLICCNGIQAKLIYAIVNKKGFLSKQK